MAKNQLNYLQNLEHCLEFGQECKRNRKHKAIPYSVDDLGPLTQVTYRCNICNSPQDTLYNTSWYLEACKNLKYDQETLKPIGDRKLDED